MKYKIFMDLLFAVVLVFNSGGCSNLDASNPGRSDLAYQLPVVLDGSLQNPAWSPDGKSIILTRFRNGYNKGPADLVLYDLEGGHIRILVSNGSDNINLPGSAWNPATNLIAFSSSREPHDEIFVIRADANPGEEIKVTERDQLAAYEPSFSPDGQWIVFESHHVDDSGNGVITKHKIDGTEPDQILTDANDDCRQPNWAPDGRRILYQAFNDGQWDIWMMDQDGTNQRQITSGAGDKTDASFSPDGQWIVYSADCPTMEHGNLFIAALLGSEPKRVTEFGGYDGAPSWSPDGEKIVFESSSGNPEDTPGTTIWMMNVVK